ncbi:MAG: peptide chain release factor 2 [Buchnera aphidicola (Periphyllus lyropictus)]|uniref:peptide chain release factor 2 n=1 Tax=Buchnera aphidicola TaxID=9 RepID=UPI001EC27991|nr:peptide chain release factor 2 [Buchnera aphidicola]NIH16544.1 peptide chain release factor 2 [Buchnera aphidicola (Periphyllus lyropictus)]USS94437.1 peptide chain release factor 2 [Buchnera aphidicola (Periphyllus lyropictus)]
MKKFKKILKKIKKSSKKIKKIRKCLELKKLKKRFLEINYILKNKKNWNKINLIKKLNKEKNNIYKKISQIKSIQKKIKENKNLIYLSLEISDYSILLDIIKTTKKIEKKIEILNFQTMFKKKYDFKNCYIDIQSGSGGIEAQDWSKMLLNMYLKWAYKKKFITKIINISNDEFNGIKSATLKVKGNYAFGWLRTESGIHRLVRKSPFNTGNKRHTSFSSIYIYPIIKKHKKVKIKKSDLKISVYKASGAGGQHVNKTESAVRIKHLPTGITVQCQSNRSQHKNKKQAIKQIKSKIFNQIIEKNKKKKQEKNKNKEKIKWGNQIRSYVLDNSLIKDIRTGIETKNIEKFLNGKIDKFIKKNLKSGF